MVGCRKRRNASIAGNVKAKYRPSHKAADTINTFLRCERRMSVSKNLVADNAHDLAFIAKVSGFTPIIGRDDLELAFVKGWRCIVQKGLFNVGDLGVYCAIGSIPGRNGRVKTVSMGGVISQGVLSPMSILSDCGVTDITRYKEDDSVAKEMNVKKYIAPEELAQYKKTSSNEPFPESVPKTESIRIQHDPVALLTAIQDKNITITRKEDGCSCTFMYLDGVIRICSRNYAYDVGAKGGEKHYALMYEKYDIDSKLRTLKRNIAIQGEIVVPSINGNRMKLSKLAFSVFDIFDIDLQRYYSYDDMLSLCAELQLQTVPLLYRGPACCLNLTSHAVNGLMHTKLNIIS